jgi:maltose alpha-D-glucosyltransferase/alpha-amylase
MMAGMWYQDAVFYEVSCRSFCDGNGDGVGDLQGLMNRLDHLVELGVDCLWLLPIYPSPLRDDGYDVSDFCAIHPDLGTMDDFKSLLAACKARGLRVIIDLVLNHTSCDHPWFQAAREGPDNPYHHYYVWRDDSRAYADARIIFIDTEDSNWTYDAQCGRYYWHRFFRSQPDLNFDNPAVHEAMLKVVAFWIDLGVDGFRVDAVPYLYEREGTNCENLPETIAFVKKMRRFLDTCYPQAILLGEVNQWPQDVLPYFGEGDGFHMNFHFPLMPRLFLALARGDRTPIVTILEQTPTLPPGCQWATFLRNHDELTLEMVNDTERQELLRHYAPEPGMRLNIGIRRRLFPLLDNHLDKVCLAYGLLFSLGGSPVLYYGDEIGMGDDWHLPDRHGVRTAMQWDGSLHAGFSNNPSPTLPTPVLDKPGPFHYLACNLAAKRAEPDSIYHRLRRMLALRARNKSLASGTLCWVHPKPLDLLAFVKTLGDERILVLANLTAHAKFCELPLEAWQGCTPVVLGEETAFPVITEKPYPLNLAPYQLLWLQLLPVSVS